jgi:hypothetical protein
VKGESRWGREGWAAYDSAFQTTTDVNFTADGNWLRYHDVDSAGKHSLFRVATGGGQPERLGDFPTNSSSGTLEVSPDYG